MRIFRITDINGLVETIDRCAGSIDCVNTSGEHCDLKGPEGMRSILHMIDRNGSIPELEVYPQDMDDVTLLLRFASEMNLAS